MIKKLYFDSKLKQKIKSFVIGYFLAPFIILILLSQLVPSNDLGFIMITLLGIFPLIFLIQGILCALKKFNFILSIIVSLISFLIGMIYFTKDTSAAIFYVKIYMFLSIIGFLTTKLILKYKK